MSITNHYAVLGILPGAEDIVVTAAYRALAQRYHPDRWSGDKIEAHARMSEINEAYRVLHDPNLRAEYDQQLLAQDSCDFTESDDAERERAFESALAEIEERWLLAASIFPDLLAIRKKLSKISSQLAFAYVVTLVETKAFSNRQDIAAALEKNFLKRYFGADPKITDFALKLILGGQREAAKFLNSLVDVLGSRVDPSLIMRKVESEFSLVETGGVYSRQPAERTRLCNLAAAVLETGYVDLARDLAESAGYSLQERDGGFFSEPSIGVLRDLHVIHSFSNYVEFVTWVQKEVCPNFADES